MTTKGAKKETAKAKGAEEITFKCRICEETKPYSDMVVMTRFFPPLTACKSCALKMDYAEEREQSQEVS